MKRSQHVVCSYRESGVRLAPLACVVFQEIRKQEIFQFLNSSHAAWVEFVTDQKYTFGRQTRKCMIKYCKWGNLGPEYHTLLKK